MVRILITLLILTFNILKCQINLVPNSSFENHTTCPNFGGQLNDCNNWNNVNLVYGNFTVGTPDYFHICGSGGVVPPNTFSGVCAPHTGNAMIGTVLYNIPYPDYREYVSSQLICPMLAGSTYTVSFWITNGSGPISPYAIKNIGANFSNSPLIQSGYSLINLSPQCEVTSQVASTSWVQYTFTITATSNWSYITLGCFRPDANNAPTSVYPGTSGNPSAYANYFWDDIEVYSKDLTVASFNYSISNCGDTVSFTNTSSNASSYHWLFDNGLTTTTGSPSVILNQGVHTITLTAMTASCSDTIVKTIQVDATNINANNLPNVFTPNEDGVNDIFDLSKLKKCNDFDFEIFDRWGLSILKSTETKQNFWDGRTTSGMPVSDGTYFYIIRDKKGNNARGTVTVFR